VDVLHGVLEVNDGHTVGFAHPMDWIKLASKRHNKVHCLDSGIRVLDKG
jgi:hypothetical protein